MRIRLRFFLLVSISLIVILAFTTLPGRAQGGTCCAASWKLPVQAGTWLITQGDKDSCVSSHCDFPGNWKINLYALDIVSNSEQTIKTMGAPVLAPADGTVFDELWDGYGGGNVLKIEHGNGGALSVYLHLSAYLVGKGAVVKQGDPVAKIGNSTTPDQEIGPHLHVVVFQDKSMKQGLKIVSWDGNTDFATGSRLTSTNGSGPIPVTQTSAPVVLGKPTLSQPRNNSTWSKNTEITLVWNASTGAPQYKVELWGGPYSLMVPCDWQNGVSCRIGTMFPGTFFWHVQARNSSGKQSEWSDTWSFTIQEPVETPRSTETPLPVPTRTPVPAPQAPAAPALRSPANNKNYPPSKDIQFAWNYVSNADQYYLEYWGGPYDTLNSGWITDVAYHIGTMWPGTYQWHVKARNQNGLESNWSDTWTFTVAQQPTAIPPTNTRQSPTLTPKPPTNTPRPAFVGNIAPRAQRSPDGIGSGNAFDGDLSTFWTDGLGHRFSLTLSLPGTFDVSRILVWDRPQNSPDNQQINEIVISLSNGWSKRFDMISGGPRCIDVTLASPQTIASVTLQADNASGNNGLSEVEIWVGPKTGGPTCSNSGTMP